jgi:hypothetical protein
LAFTSVKEANAINKADSVIALSPFIVQDVVMSGANANVYIIDPKGATDGVFLIYVEGGNLGLAKGDSVEEKEVIKLAFTSVAEANAITAKKDSVIALNSFMVQDVVVSGSNASIYIIDPLGANIGASLIYDAGNTLGLAAGDVVDGFIGKTSPYHNLPELIPMVKTSDLTIVHHGSGLEILNPTSWSLAPTAEVLNKYIKMENVTVEAGEFTTSDAVGLTANVASTDFTLYNQLRRAYTFEAGKTYDILGYGAIRDDTYQVYFYSAEEHVVTALDEAVEAGKAVKVVRDGQVIILRGKKAYNLVGAEL